tara:strand:+ start:582 stop:794 length:213 start_codon:yes stop_codon:yes gene_type:complete
MNNNSLYYVSAISWDEVDDDIIVNVDGLQKREYIEVPKNLDKNGVFRFIDQKLYESTLISPWYYNIEKIA